MILELAFHKMCKPTNITKKSAPKNINNTGNGLLRNYGQMS